LAAMARLLWFPNAVFRGKYRSWKSNL